MHTQDGLRAILNKSGFNAKAKDAIMEFLCKTLSELANMSSRDLDVGVLNLHKALSNVTTVAHRVRLNVTKCILLHAICLHFLDRINCLALVNQADIDAHTQDNVAEM